MTFIVGGINIAMCWCDIEILLMTKNFDLTGIEDYIKSRRFAWEHGRASRLHTNKGKSGYPYPNYPSKYRFAHSPVTAQRTRMCRKWYLSSRETEEPEKDEGSLSISIVPFERWEISPMKASK